MKRSIVSLPLILGMIFSVNSYAQHEFAGDDPTEQEGKIFRKGSGLPGEVAPILDRWKAQYGTNTVPEELDSLIESLMNEYDVPGLTLAIVRDGRIIWRRPYGLADVPNHIPWRANTIHHVFSISKTILADALMQLYEHGNLDLDAPVNTYLALSGSPIRVENPNYPGVPITIRMLMTHSSSIRDDVGMIISHGFDGDNPMDYTEFLETHPFSYTTNTPGTQYRYTNVGSCLLAYILEKRLGIPFVDYVRDNIFSPLGMDNTSYFLSDLDTNLIARGKGIYNFYTVPLYPIAYVRTTVPSLAKFQMANMYGGAWNRARILEDTTVDRMLTPTFHAGDNFDFGLLWYKVLVYDRIAWGHDGAWADMGYTEYFFDRETQTGYITAMNCNRPAAPFWASFDPIFFSLIDIVNPRALSTPSRLQLGSRGLDTVMAYTFNNLYGPLTITSMSFDTGDSLFSLVDMPLLPLTLNEVSDSLVFRVAYHGPGGDTARSVLRIGVSDSVNPSIEVPVVRRLRPVMLSRYQMDFGLVYDPEPRMDSLFVHNPGPDTLGIDSVTCELPLQFSVSPLMGEIPPMDSLKFYVTFHPVSFGAYPGRVWFANDVELSPSVLVISGKYGPHSVQCGVGAGWNMLSMPMQVDDPRKGVVYPGASSGAFGYVGGYTQVETLRVGEGFWLKYSSTQTIEIPGDPVIADTIPVGARWNIVGSISSPVPVAAIGSDPPGIVTTQFHAYSPVGGYSVADTIRPGFGYWVKTSAAGSLILSAPGNIPAAKRIAVVPTDEAPPAPPDGKAPADARPMPAEYALGQNFPNPFNPVTTISYGLPTAGHVRLSVFDILGQEVAVLVDEVQGAGYKTMAFDGAMLPSGVYTCRITAGTMTKVIKMLLMK